MALLHSPTTVPLESRIAEHIKKAFELLRIDLEDEDFQESPERIARVWMEFTQKKRSSIPNIKTFPCKEDGLVLVDNIDLNFLCPHHWVPCSGVAHIGYIPRKKVIGLSKIIRIAQWCATFPATQENLTVDIIDTFEKLLQPQGTMVIVSAQHGCMRYRGVKAAESFTTTSAIRGVFSKPPKGKNPREEMLELLKLRR